jgi:hypothetical protein
MLKTGRLTLLICCIVAAVLSSCNEPDVLGLNLQPDEEQLGLTRIDTFQLNAYVTPEDSLITSRTDQPLFMGSISDPSLFGSTLAGFAMQVRLGNTISSSTFNNATAVDSIVLSFGWRARIGDSTVTHRVSVYQLADNIYPDSVYYSNKTYSTSTLLGHKEFVPELNDSVAVNGVNKTPQFRMALDTAVGGKFLRDYIANPADFASQAAFLTYFKGIVLVDSADAGGSIITLEPGSNFNRLTLYYGNGTGEYEFVLDNNSSRFNWFRHDYNADLEDTLNDPRLIIQSMAGLKTKISIPWLLELKNRFGNISINNAQMIFKLSPGTDAGGFTPHDNLIVFGSDSSGANTLLIDATESSLYYGGVYNSSTGEYKFNIGRYVQRVLTGQTDYGLYLVAGGSTTNARRTVLQGGANVRFIVTYTLVNP